MSTLLVSCVVFLILAIIRVPLALSMLATAIVCLLFNGRALGMVAATAYGSIDVFAFLAIPGFLFAGDLMLHGKVAEVILAEVNKLGGKVRSTLGTFAVILSMMFGTILGAGTAVVSLVGGMLIPMCLRAPAIV